MSSRLGRSDVHLDAAALDRLRLTFRDEATFQDVLREFLTSSRSLQHQIEAGGPDVQLAAHTLKSMARLVGADALAEACRVVEFAAHGARAQPVPRPLVAAIAFHMQHAREELERLLA
ncbi:MAG TPA: Hpt domain-containing protein [Candidatus Thermoplasmatota archaeon]|nr:Hpt domain-containing protein [Candidatus Thermoplasmatota archaeon]